MRGRQHALVDSFLEEDICYVPENGSYRHCNVYEPDLPDVEAVQLLESGSDGSNAIDQYE